MPLSVKPIVNRSPGLLTEAGMFPGMRQREAVSLKEVQLINCEFKDPRNVSWSNGEEVVVFYDEGHVLVFI